MTITQQRDGSDLTITLEGKLDTKTAPELSDVVNTSLDGVTKLTFDLDKLEYVSSAGLRVLLLALRTINKANGEVIAKNINEAVMDVFDMTGFIDDITILD